MTEIITVPAGWGDLGPVSQQRVLREVEAVAAEAVKAEVLMTQIFGAR